MDTSFEIRQHSTSARQSPVKRLVYLSAGHLLFGLGALGIFLPVMPTTVFWIGAAACYLRSSPDRYRELISRHHHGKTISNFLEHGVICSAGKKVAVAGMLLSVLVLLLLPIDFSIKVFSVLGIALAATYVLTRPGKI